MPQPFRLTLADLARQLESEPRFASQIEALRELPAREARYGPWPEELHPDLRPAAAQLGIERLYRHQSLAVAAALQGEHVATVAGTASGKSLAYLLPMLDGLLRRPEARALLLFPTKALARDQLAVLQAWDALLPDAGLKPAAYDGDTPQNARRTIRRESRVIVSNPDMLHAGILPRHADWADFLGGLSDLVLDEMHVYRGIFGSHVANLLRRLRRLTRFHAEPWRGGAEEGDREPGSDWASVSGGSSESRGPEEFGGVGECGNARVSRRFGRPGRPRLSFGSATIANPGQLASWLAGAPVTVVDDDGAPRGPKRFFIYNPPLVDEELNLRRSAILEAETLARRCLAAGVQTIVFARTRQTAELVLRYLGEGLGKEGWKAEPEDGMPLVRGYRGGYTAGERREIEAALREGRLRGVVATNALELGIDIGQLDACVMVGYPGSIASTWQQAGRAGRRGEEALAILVASASPIDQFIARHPDYLFEGSPEHARIDPDHLLLLLDHLRCAAFELPFDADEAARPFGVDPDLEVDDVEPESDEDPDAMLGSDSDSAASRTGDPPPTAGELLAVLEARGELQRVGAAWHWMSGSYPAESVSLRSAGPQAVAIVRLDAEAEERGLGDASSSMSELRSALRSVRAGQVAGTGRTSREEVLGTVEYASAPLMLHPGAVYLHDGACYQVETLDLEAGRAHVRQTDGSIYTRASSQVDIRPLRVFAERKAKGVEMAQGELEVRTRATGYRRIRFRTHETLGWGEIDLPEQEHVAGGYWFALTEETVEELRAMGRWKHDPVRDRGPSWARQAELARERDGRRCRICNAPEREGRAHDVHHIRPFREFGWIPGRNENHRLANELDNLISLCKGCHSRAERALGLHGGLQGLGHALGHVAPLFLMCDGRDLGVKTESQARGTGRPTVTVYERSAAGLGFGEALFELHERLIRASAELIEACPCRLGCPACVGPAGDLGPDAKRHALGILRALHAGPARGA